LNIIKHYVEEFKEKRFPNHFMWIFPPLCDRLALQHASPVLQADVEAMHAMRFLPRGNVQMTNCQTWWI
jgi:hypothetical protein